MEALVTLPRAQLESMSRKGLLASLDERTRREVVRIETVFQKAPQLKAHRNEIELTEFGEEYLRLLFDPAFEPTHEQLDEMSYEQLLAVHIAMDPVMWAKTMLGVRPRAYQTLMLRWPFDQKVLRLGRRLGKTWTLALKALWHVYVNARSPVLVVAPMKSHVELIYKQIMEFASYNDVVGASIVRAIRSPQFYIELENGSTISFFTAGIRSGGKADVARGQEAHIIILDEADMLHLDDLNALYAMLQQTSDEYVEKEFWASSTPTGRRELFYEWARSDDFMEFWFPSLCNPRYDKETDDKMRRQLSQIGYEHEILAVWGEAAEGVFPPRIVDPAFRNKEFPHISLPAEHGTVVMGIDWGKYSAGSHITVCDYFPSRYPDKKYADKVRFINKAIIPKSQFTLTQAVEKTIKWNKLYNPEYIYVDKGYGEMQYESLLAEGKRDPSSGLTRKLRGINYGGATEVYTPFGIENKDNKAFMVDCLRRLFEEGQVIIPEGEEQLYRELLAYMVIRTTHLGKPVFEAVNAEDHLFDSFLLACFAVCIEVLRWNKVGKESSRILPLSAGVSNPLVRAPENEREEEVAEKLRDRGVGVATQRSFTSTTSRGGRSRREYRRKTF